MQKSDDKENSILKVKNLPGSGGKGSKQYSILMYTEIDGIFQSKTSDKWVDRKFWRHNPVRLEDKIQRHN